MKIRKAKIENRPDWLADGQELLGVFLTDNQLQVIVTRDDGRLHLSVAHPERYPTWDEIRDLRYSLLPNDVVMAMLLPPKEQYVNHHPNCFHLYEVGAERARPRLIVPASYAAR